MKNAQDEHFLHIGVSVEFGKTGSSTTHPAHVFITMKKVGAKDHLSYSRHGKYNPATGLYQITFDFSRDMEHLNGNYEIQVHASDYRAEKSE